MRYGPKERFMPPLDDKTATNLKLAEARFQQQLFASDSTWDHLLQMHQICKRVLPHRKAIQSLAQRCQKNPVRFCEMLVGRNWFEPPKQLSARQAQTLLDAAPQITRSLAAPHEMQEVDARLFLKMVRTLSAKRAAGSG